MFLSIANRGREHLVCRWWCSGSCWDFSNWFQIFGYLRTSGGHDNSVPLIVPSSASIAEVINPMGVCYMRSIGQFITFHIHEISDSMCHATLCPITLLLDHYFRKGSVMINPLVNVTCVYLVFDLIVLSGLSFLFQRLHIRE